MNFLKEKISSFNSSKRILAPRKWTPEDHYFYKQIIRHADHIDYIPSSIAYNIANIVRSTSVLISDWKKVARSLGIDNEEQLKTIEDAARYKQELPLYVALTSQYIENPAASLGALLNSLMKIKRYDILIKIKHDIKDVIDENNRQRITNTTPSSQQKSKNQPVEEESMKSFSAYRNITKDKNIEDSNPETRSYRSKNYDSTFYDQHSPPNSLLTILSKSDETMKSNDSIDCCHSRDKKYDSLPSWKERYQNKENFAGNKKIPSANEVDTLGIADFQFIDPTGNNQSLSKNMNEIELSSENSNACCNEVTENGINVKTNLPSTVYINSSILTDTESVRSNNTSSDHYDSDTTCDEDFDTVLVEEQEFLQEALSATNSHNQSIDSAELSTLSIDCDNRRIENERIQHLDITEYGGEGRTQFEDQYSGTESETYDINNTVNERIENFVAEKDKSIRNLERAERESVPLKICETMKKPQDYLFSLVSSILHDSSIDVDDSIKVIVVHSEEDSDTAVALAAALVNEFHMTAVAECQLSAIWIMDPCYYKTAALYWADIIIPLITNTWLSDINNEKPLLERETSSLNARSVFRILQNIFLNRGSVNLSSIPVVMEGTSRHFIYYPEIRDAVKLSKNFHTDVRMKRLVDLINNFHKITRDAKRALLE